MTKTDYCDAIFSDLILIRKIRITTMRLIIVPVWDINHLEAELQVSSFYRESNSGRFRCIRNSQLKKYHENSTLVLDAYFYPKIFMLNGGST